MADPVRNDTSAAARARRQVATSQAAPPQTQPKPEANKALSAQGWDGQSTFEAGEDSKVNLGGPLAGAIGGQQRGILHPDEKCSAEVAKFYEKIAAAVAQKQAEVGPQVAELKSQRSDLATQSEAAKADYNKLLDSKPPKDDPAAGAEWGKQNGAKLKDIASEIKRLDKAQQGINKKIEKLNQSTVEVDGMKFSALNPREVAAAVTDHLTGKTYLGLNGPNSIEGVSKDLHPLLADRLAKLDPQTMHGSVPATHAEVHALNEALWAREARNGGPLRGDANSTKKPTVTGKDLGSFSLDTRWLKGNENNPASDGMVPGNKAPRCNNCRDLTTGVRNLAGDANPVSEKPPKSPAFHSAGDAVKGGAKTGALFSAAMSGYGALKSGHFDPAKLGKEVAIGAGAGAASGLVEHAATNLIDRGIGAVGQRVAGKAANSGVVGSAARSAFSSEVTAGAGSLVRSTASRIGGAGVAGAVVNAGFSAVDQIQAYQEGKVTGSQAVGTVVGEATVGFGAGAAGAAAGAAIGSIVPVAGTAVGAVVGFAVGLAADKLLRAGGADKAIAGAVTAGLDGGTKLVQGAGEVMSKGVEEGRKVFGGIAGAAKKLFSW